MDTSLRARVRARRCARCAAGRSSAINVSPTPSIAARIIRFQIVEDERSFHGDGQRLLPLIELPPVHRLHCRTPMQR